MIKKNASKQSLGYQMRFVEDKFFNIERKRHVRSALYDQQLRIYSVQQSTHDKRCWSRCSTNFKKNFQTSINEKMFSSTKILFPCRQHKCRDLLRIERLLTLKEREYRCPMEFRDLENEKTNEDSFEHRLDKTKTFQWKR